MLGVALFQQPQQPTRVVQIYDGVLRVEAATIRRDIEGSFTEASGNVVATYGADRITADRLIIHEQPEDGYAEAVGKVTLTDPEGTVTAENLQFSWKDHTGRATNVMVRVSSLTVTAESIDIKPDIWTLTNVGGTACTLKTPIYFFRTRRLTYRPGIGALAEKPEISLFGKKIATIPDQKFGGDSEGQSFEIPLPQYRPGQGFGVSWRNQLSLSQSAAIDTDYNVFQKAKPSYSAYLVKTFEPSDSPDLPRSELNERTGFGYFDSIQVRDPISEANYLRRKTARLGIGALAGTGARNTTTADDKLNKPLEGFAQWSGSVGSVGALAIARAQQVRLGDQATNNRGLLEVNVGSPLVRLSETLTSFARLDTATYFGASPYSFQRAQLGIVWQPSAPFRIGAAYVVGGDQGTPLYPYDTLERKRELNFRADLDLEQTQLRVLLKFDPNGKSLFDQEIYFSQVIGCIEPFVVYRKNPRKFFIGLKLPIGHVFDRLAQRQSLRREIISGPGAKP